MLDTPPDVSALFPGAGWQSEQPSCGIVSCQTVQIVRSPLFIVLSETLSHSFAQWRLYPGYDFELCTFRRPLFSFPTEAYQSFVDLNPCRNTVNFSWKNLHGLFSFEIASCNNRVSLPTMVVLSDHFRQLIHRITSFKRKYWKFSKFSTAVELYDVSWLNKKHFRSYRVVRIW